MNIINKLIKSYDLNRSLRRDPYMKLMYSYKRKSIFNIEKELGNIIMNRYYKSIYSVDKHYLGHLKTYYDEPGDNTFKNEFKKYDWGVEKSVYYFIF